MIRPKNWLPRNETLAEKKAKEKDSSHPLTYRDAYTFQQPPEENIASTVQQASATEDIFDGPEESPKATTQ